MKFFWVLMVVALAAQVGFAADYPRFPGTRCVSFLGADVRPWIDPAAFARAVRELKGTSLTVKTLEEKLAWIQVAQERSGQIIFPVNEAVGAQYSLTFLKRLVRFVGRLKVNDGVTEAKLRYISAVLVSFQFEERFSVIGQLFPPSKELERAQWDTENLSRSLIAFAHEMGMIK